MPPNERPAKCACGYVGLVGPRALSRKKTFKSNRLDLALSSLEAHDIMTGCMSYY
jgi:hypothetical protein